MIRLDSLTKVYQTKSGPLVLFDGITESLPTDRNIGILGRNGCGKSTLLRVIAKAEQPTSGHVWSSDHLSWPMGFSGGFQTNLTALDNVRFVSRVYGADWREVAESVQEFAELGPYIQMPVATFSSGMRARLSIALSLAFRFDVYLVDEVPGVGDARFRARFNAAFKRLKNEASMILVSHSPAAIRLHCDCLYLLSQGRLRFFEDVEEGLRAYQNE